MSSHLQSMPFLTYTPLYVIMQNTCNFCFMNIIKNIFIFLLIVKLMTNIIIKHNNFKANTMSYLSSFPSNQLAENSTTYSYLYILMTLKSNH